MLLEFTVGNFLSFKEPVTLSLEAASITDYPENAFVQGRYSLLKSAVVYGANASGKSNLIQAIAQMRHIVKSSVRMTSTDTFEVTPFLLSTETEAQPSFFEVLILVDDLRYRYGFEITAEKVHTEWLYRAKVQAEKPLFIRDGDAIEVSPKFSEGKSLAEKTRDNALFLAVCDQFNGPIAGKIMEWFTFCNTISGLSHENYRVITSRLLGDEQCRPAMLDFLEKLDLGFEEVEVSEEEFNPEALPDTLPLAMRLRLSSEFKGKKRLVFKALHDVYDPQGKKVSKREFDLDSQESSGTNKIFDLLGPFFDTLLSGRVLVVDELDAKLHPLLTKALVSLFNSDETNPQNAQLIFATHDTNLLTYGHFRRDQIYFVEKDREGATSLYSLIEYKEEGGKTVRSDRSFEKDYVQGRYGAIPYLGDFSKLFREWQERKKVPNHVKKRLQRREKKRKEAVRSKRIYFLIVCEGEKTEPLYFEALKNDLPKGVLENAVIEIEGEGKNTLSLIEEVHKIRTHREKAAGRSFDQTWAVFDRDSFPPQNFNNAIFSARAAVPEIRCAWSNEAFELWYLLHFEFYQDAASRHDYAKRLEEAIAKRLNTPFKYAKNDPNMYHLLKQWGNRIQAIAWAENLHEWHQGENFADHNPCTLVYQLVAELLTFDNPTP